MEKRITPNGKIYFVNIETGISRYNYVKDNLEIIFWINESEYKFRPICDYRCDIDSLLETIIVMDPNKKNYICEDDLYFSVDDEIKRNNFNTEIYKLDKFFENDKIRVVNFIYTGGISG